MGLDDGLAPNRWQTIIWTNDGLGYWHLYASLGLTELKYIVALSHCGMWPLLLTWFNFNPSMDK